MSNAVVTPLFPTGSRVQAWCVSNLLSRRTTSDTISTTTGTLTNLNGTTVNRTQEEMDTLNFIDGYNVRLDRRCIGNFNGGANERFPFYFTFITPLASSNYRVFAQVRHSPTKSVWKGGPAGYTFLPWTTMSILNTPRYPKTRYGFFVESLYMSSRGAGDWTPLSIQGHPLGVGGSANWLGAAYQPNDPTNTTRTSLINLVVL